MLKMIILCMFMIPLISNYWILCNMIALTTLIFMFFFNKICLMVGYMMKIDKISFSLIMLSIWIMFLMIIFSVKFKSNKMFSFMVLLLMFFLILSFLLKV